jgi:Zn-dependent protease with chaperone function/tellurite resistance protein
VRSAEEIRCLNDRRLFDALLATAEVKRANELLDRMAEKGPLGVRRHLLATSVRLTSGMAPAVHTMADECSSVLGIESSLELFVYSSPNYNAACLKPEDGRLFIMFSSSLLEAFEGNELKFVVGHELGHHVFRHHEIPIGFILSGGASASPRLALDLFAWSRYAEISADRSGAYCAGDLEATARALFKLASGLSGRSIKFSLEDFLAQIDAMQIETQDPRPDGPRQDWFLTHPFSPLRVKALTLFHDSELVRDGGTSSARLEETVQSLMGLMEPSYLEGHTETAESMRRLLFSGTIAIASADGEISEKEIDLFEQFFGEGTFRKGLDIEAITKDLEGRIEQARSKTSTPQRIQVLRDLCLVAQAGSRTGTKERAVLKKIAAALEVPENIVGQTFDCSLDLD